MVAISLALSFLGVLAFAAFAMNLKVQHVQAGRLEEVASAALTATKAASEALDGYTFASERIKLAEERLGKAELALNIRRQNAV